MCDAFCSRVCLCCTSALLLSCLQEVERLTAQLLQVRKERALLQRQLEQHEQQQQRQGADRASTSEHLDEQQQQQQQGQQQRQQQPDAELANLQAELEAAQEAARDQQHEVGADCITVFVFAHHVVHAALLAVIAVIAILASFVASSLGYLLFRSTGKSTGNTCLAGMQCCCCGSWCMLSASVACHCTLTQSLARARASTHHAIYHSMIILSVPSTHSVSFRNRSHY
jgi:hypothetical protein